MARSLQDYLGTEAVLSSSELQWWSGDRDPSRSTARQRQTKNRK